MATVVRAADGDVDRGKYLVEEVAKCQDCHTPRDAKGELDKSRWLKGTTLDFQPMKPVDGWHATSPDLTPSGRLWKRWGAEKLTRFLTTGIGPGGHAADAPMPAFRLREDDAKAIVAYLESLK